MFSRNLLLYDDLFKDEQLLADSEGNVHYPVPGANKNNLLVEQAGDLLTLSWEVSGKKNKKELQILNNFSIDKVTVKDGIATLHMKKNTNKIIVE